MITFIGAGAHGASCLAYLGVAYLLIGPGLRDWILRRHFNTYSNTSQKGH